MSVSRSLDISSRRRRQSWLLAECSANCQLVARSTKRNKFASSSATATATAAGCETSQHKSSCFAFSAGALVGRRARHIIVCAGQSFIIFAHTRDAPRVGRSVGRSESQLHSQRRGKEEKDFVLAGGQSIGQRRPHQLSSLAAAEHLAAPEWQFRGQQTSERPIETKHVRSTPERCVAQRQPLAQCRNSRHRAGARAVNSGGACSASNNCCCAPLAPNEPSGLVAVAAAAAVAQSDARRIKKPTRRQQWRAANESQLAPAGSLMPENSRETTARRLTGCGCCRPRTGRAAAAKQPASAGGRLARADFSLRSASNKLAAERRAAE